MPPGRRVPEGSDEEEIDSGARVPLDHLHDDEENGEHFAGSRGVV